ncbi:MAG: ABC transporter permease [Candidatus Dormibacteraeota bacterium]|nr:ABC transporter permease [Candidatus Dormibacteraeota bacterium]MBO0760355.1 ABC transporter permease [Candidatus Dormibacteraeota bacterium]
MTLEAGSAEQGVAPEQLASRGGSRLGRFEPWLIGIVSVLVFLAAWQAVATARVVPELFLPGPIDIASALAQYVASPEFVQDVATSGQELLLGFGLAIVTGLPIGLLIGWYRRLRYALDPFISFFYSVPRIALLPLLIIWFGIGIWSKVAVIYLGAFFPIAINTLAGIRSLDPSLLKAARSFGASDLQIFRTIALPGSVPFILTGIRLGVGHALIGVVVGELVAAQHGVGLAMATAGSTFQTSKVFAGLIIIAGVGVILQILLQRLENHFDSWRPR